MTNVAGMSIPMPAMPTSTQLVSPQVAVLPQAMPQQQLLSMPGPTAPTMGVASPMMVMPGMGIPRAMLPAGYGQMPASFAQAMLGAEATRPPSKLGTIIKSVVKTAALGAAIGAGIGLIPRLPPTIMGGALIGGALGAVLGVVRGMAAAKAAEDEFRILQEQAQAAAQAPVAAAAPAPAPPVLKKAAPKGGKPHAHYPDVAKNPMRAKHAKTWVQLAPKR